MKKNLFLHSILSVASLCLLSSCATLVTGTSPSVIIDGNAKEPVTIVTSYQTYVNMTLPAQVKVKRKHLDGQRIQVMSENYSYRDIMLSKGINEWAFGNILIGGLIGWGVDLLTNCVSKPADSRYYVVAEPLGAE